MTDVQIMGRDGLSLGRGPFCDPTILPFVNTPQHSSIKVLEFNISLKPSSKLIKHVAVNIKSTFQKRKKQ